MQILNGTQKEHTKGLEALLTVSVNQQIRGAMSTDPIPHPHDQSPTNQSTNGAHAVTSGSLLLLLMSLFPNRSHSILFFHPKLKLLREMPAMTAYFSLPSFPRLTSSTQLVLHRHFPEIVFMLTKTSSGQHGCKLSKG